MSLGEDIGDMAEDLVAEHGTDLIYARGNKSHQLRGYVSRQMPVTLETEPGHYIEVVGVDILTPTASLLMGDPLQGDRIEGGDDVYEVQPTTNQKTSRILSPLMTRVHTKRI
jgi:hypothetical protein